MSDPSTFTEAEVQTACGGPLAWPDEPERKPIYAAWVLRQLGDVFGQERVQNAVAIGTLGTRETHDQIRAGLKTLQHFNGAALHNQKATGPGAFMRHARGQA